MDKYIRLRADELRAVQAYNTDKTWNQLRVDQGLIRCRIVRGEAMRKVCLPIPLRLTRNVFSKRSRY